MIKAYKVVLSYFKKTSGMKEKKAERLLSEIVKISPFKGKAFIAGGYVRDEVMGRDPKDLDVTVEAPQGGIRLAEYVSEVLDLSDPRIFKKFGTAQVTLKGSFKENMEKLGIPISDEEDEDLTGMDIEFVQTRKETYEPYSAKPDVSPGTLQEDVDRRDFTVNTLLKDLTTGEIKDLTGKGIEDIKKGRVVTPINPEKTFSDDPSRIIRGIRFAVKYGWDLPLFIIKAMKKAVPLLKQKRIKPSSLQQELVKILQSNNPDKGIKLMYITGLSDYIMPELNKLKGLMQGKYHDWDAFKHSLETLKRSKPDLISRLSALFHDIGKPLKQKIVDDTVHFFGHEDVSAQIAEKIMTELNFSDDIKKKVTFAIRKHDRAIGFKDWTEKAVRKFVREMGDNLENVLNLMEADVASHKKDAPFINDIKELRRKIEEVKQKDKPFSNQKAISGKEIMDLLNVPTGPLVGTVKKYIDDLLDGKPFLTRDEIYDILLKKFGNK